MNINLTKFIFTAIFCLILINSASAIVTYGSWDDGTASKLATHGDVLEFNADYFSMKPPMTISIKLYDSDFDLVKTFDNNLVVNDYEYFETYILDTSELVNPTGSESYTIIFQGSDQTNPQSYSIYLILQKSEEPPINNPPVFTSNPITEINEGTYYSYQATAEDIDEDDLTFYNTINLPDWLTITQDGLLTGYSPLVNEDTEYLVGLGVTDGEAFDVQGFTITVVDTTVPNDPPVITSTPILTVDENTVYSYQVTASDPDNDPLTYELTVGPSWLSIDTNGLITGTSPVVNEDTEYKVSIRVSDGHFIDSQTFTLTVIDTTVIENNAPIAYGANYETVEDTAISLTLRGTDVDEDDLNFIVSDPEHGTLSDSNDVVVSLDPTEHFLTLTYTPNIGYTGIDSFTYRVYDGGDYSNIATVTINVKEKNPNEDTTPPVITIIFPKSRTYERNDFTFKIKTNEVATAWFKIDGTKYQMLDIGDNFFTKNIHLENDRCTVTFYAKDLAGNIAEKSVTFKVDKDSDDDGDDDHDDSCRGNNCGIDGNLDWVYGEPDTTQPQVYNDDGEEKPEIEAEDDLPDYLFWLILLLILLIVGIIIFIVFISRERSQDQNISQTQNPQNQ